MNESLIKSIRQTPATPDTLKKAKQKERPKSMGNNREKRKKQRDRIIDTYA